MVDRELGVRGSPGCFWYQQASRNAGRAKGQKMELRAQGHRLLLQSCAPGETSRQEIARDRAFLVVPDASKPLRIQAKLLIGRWNSGDRAQLSAAGPAAGIGVERGCAHLVSLLPTSLQE